MGISDEIEVATTAFDEATILQIKAMIALPFQSSLTIVSLRNRTAEKRGRQNAWAWQTWQRYSWRVLSGIHLTLMFFGLLQNYLFKRMWSLAEGFFKQNYCHACHTRFAVVFPLPSCCVSSLMLVVQRLQRNVPKSVLHVQSFSLLIFLFSSSLWYAELARSITSQNTFWSRLKTKENARQNPRPQVPLP